MLKFRSSCALFAVQAMLIGLTAMPGAHAQTTPAGSASAADDAAKGNKAAKPPVEAAASQAEGATKKPAKPGAQAGPMSTSAADAKAAKGNKAGKPPVDAAASQADVATRKPAKPGAQSGPASAPQR